MNQNKLKKIYNLNIEEIKSALESGDVKICVVGIGRIGLPTAISFANAGLSTIGVDINVHLTDTINSGNFPLNDEPGYNTIFENVIKNKKFYATTQIEEALPKTNVILLSLPTPMNKNNIPDYAALRTVGKKLNELMEIGSILIIESTIEPGFIENEFVRIVEGTDNRLKSGVNFGLGVCPETANPGEILNDFTKLPRLVGAIDNKTADIIQEIYRYVFPVEIIKMPDCKTANAVKLTTNVFRDVNIAFVNELALLFDKLGIDILKVLEAATKKYNFQVHYPGAGVGGPCLPVNSYQLLNSAKQFDENLLKIVRIGREINENMKYYVVNLILDALKEANKKIGNSTILILGISYKPNVKDIQLTPAEEIIKKLQELGAKIKIYDPFFKNSDIFGIKTESNIDCISETDAAVIITAHDEFLSFDSLFFASKMKTPTVIDSRGIIDIHEAKKVGLIFRGLGRGRI